MTTPILLLNCGSSSIKYQMIDADTEEVLAVGLVQKIGDAGAGTIEHEVDLEPRRPVTRLPVEHEGASVDLTLRISVAKRVKDEVAHVVHCLEQVALS